MRKPMMAGNWKMNKTVDESVQLAQVIRQGSRDGHRVDCVLCPTFVCLAGVRNALFQAATLPSARKICTGPKAAPTPAKSAASCCKDWPTYVILGHSERRQYFAETDESVNKKTHAAFKYDFMPIICVGESLAQNEAGETQAFVSGQVKAALAGLSADQVKQAIIAYEPIWAIGTGKAATAEQAQDICGGRRARSRRRTLR